MPERVVISLAMALQSKGCRVTVFHHGHCAGVERYPNSHRNDGRFANYFVAPTKNIAENFLDTFLNAGNVAKKISQIPKKKITVT